jgi:hypothetical protein
MVDLVAAAPRRGSTGVAGGRCSRLLLWSAAALLATGLSNTGCGGGGNDPDPYDVTVSVTSSTDLNSLHFKLYSFFNDGDWIGAGDDCTLLVEGDFDSDHIGGDPGFGPSLDINILNEDSFRAPGPVIRCGFRTAETIREDSFAVEFLDATNFTGSPTEASVAIHVERRAD